MLTNITVIIVKIIIIIIIKQNKVTIIQDINKQLGNLLIRKLKPKSIVQKLTKLRKGSKTSERKKEIETKEKGLRPSKHL